MKKLYAIEVRGRDKTWSFNVKALPEYADDWRADGLEVNEVLNSIPLWAQQMGLTHAWCAVQDAWRFLRLW